MIKEININIYSVKNSFSKITDEAFLWIGRSVKDYTQVLKNTNPLVILITVLVGTLLAVSTFALALYKNHAQAKKEKNDAIENLNATFDVQKAQQDEANEAKINEFEEKNKQLTSEISDKEKEIQQLQTQISSNGTENKQLTSEISDKNKKIEQLNNEISSKDVEKGQLAVELSKMKEQSNSDTQQANILGQDMLKLRNKNNELEQKIAELEQKITELTKPFISEEKSDNEFSGYGGLFGF